MPKAAYHLTRPLRRQSSVVFASPHSGSDYPASFVRRTQLDRHGIRSSEDAFVDLLFDGAPDFGAPFLKAGAPRAFVDLNRSPDELDPALIEGARRHGHNPRVASGLGVIPRVVANGRAIYKGKLPMAEAQRRIDEVIRRGDAAQRSVARFAWATHHMMSGRTDAIETLEEVMRDPRASTEVRARSALWLAYHHLHRGDRDEVRAMLALGGSLAAGRDDLRLMGAQLMGKLLQQEGRTAEALEVLGQAAAAAPSWRDGAESLRHVYAVLGDVHKELGQLDQAEEAYRRGLVLNRSFADAHQYIDELNLVILAVYRDRLSAFHSRLPGLRADLARTQPEHIVRFVDLVQLLVPGQGAPLNHVVDRIEEVVVVNGWRDVELAALCREVGASLARQGREADAARLERLASLVA